MNCKKVDELLPTIWQHDEEDPLRIEVEAHIFECEFCASKLDLDSFGLSDLGIPAIENKQELANASAVINQSVMERIYEEETWFRPISAKRYHFSQNFRRKVSLIIACCLAMFSVAMFAFIFDFYQASQENELASATGVIDVAKATSDGFVNSALYTSSIPVASISAPIVMQVVPTFPQYYVALSFIGIILTLLVMSWFTRTRQ